jgi:hypothetical protein
MALYIRDPEVDELVAELQRLTKTATKTEVVKAALKKQIEAGNADLPLMERLAPVFERAAHLAPSGTNFDMKAFMDEMWGDI